MKYLLKAVKVHDTNSSFHQKVTDILIEDGIITQLVSDIVSTEEMIEISGESLIVSQGWIDLKAHFCDPGEEHKETIEKGLNSAAFGGFTHVCSLPSTHPVSDNKTQIEYQLRKSENHLVQLHPYGTVTHELKGENMAEYYDMMQAGAIAFTDDQKRINSGILYRALLYSKTFGGRIIAFSKDAAISNGGIVNEGYTSTMTGLKADPAVAEWIDIDRNIRLAKYTEGNLHLTAITTAESVELVRKAKAEGISVTADVHVEHLIFNDSQNLDFDSNYKFNPVLRNENDRQALWAGLYDGTIDFIVSNHRPMDTEEKEVVFDDASAGNIRLQTFINELMLAPEFNLEKVITIISERNRTFLNLPQPSTIEIGATADLTVFAPNQTWEFDKNSLISGCRNTYMLNKTLKGSVLAVINKGQIQYKD